MTLLPLVDNHLIVDNSTMELFQSCPRALQYSWLEKRELAVERAALNFGKAIHVALDTRYRLCGSKATAPQDEAMINDTLAKHFEVYPQPPEDHRTLQLAQAVARRYNKVYKNEPFSILTLPSGKPYIESSFLFPLGTIDAPANWGLVKTIAVDFAGRSDLGVQNNEGEWVKDHKTSKEFGVTFWDEMAIAPQFRGYCWAFQQAYGHLPRGYCINGVRVRKPTKDSVYDDNMGVRDDDFGRQFFLVSQSDIDEWKTNILAMCEELLWHHARQFFPQKKRWCVGKYGRCEFYDVCSLPMQNREEMLKSSLYQEKTWSPLNPV